MKLVTIYKEGVKPFIGIVYENKKDGEKVDNGLISIYGSHPYTLTLFVEPGKVSACLTTPALPIFKLNYNLLPFDAIQFILFLDKTRDRTSYNFGHCFVNENGELQIVRVGANQVRFVLNIAKLIING